jgi:hypothetical protein
MRITTIAMYTSFIFLFCAKSLAFGSKKPVSYLPCDEKDFWWAVMMAESGGNPKAVYMEAWGEESLGLYMLSVSDSKRYKDCPDSREALFNPIINTKCKDSIFNTLRKRYPDKNVWEVGGMYWSTLRNPTYWKNKPLKPYKNFKYFAAKKGC